MHDALPLPPSICTGHSMMFSQEDRALMREDRALLVRLEAKLDLAQNQIQVVQQKQATHEAICDQREAIAKEYRANLDTRERKSENEWDEFQKESRADRQHIRDEVWKSTVELRAEMAKITNQLLGRVIGAMFVLLLAASGAVIGLAHLGIPAK